MTRQSKEKASRKAGLFLACHPATVVDRDDQLHVTAPNATLSKGGELAYIGSWIGYNMGIAVLDKEFQELSASFSQFPSFETEMEDASAAARRHDRRIRSWRSSVMTRLAKLRHLFQIAENDPSGEAITELLGRFRPEVLRVIDQSAAEVAIRPRDLDEKLEIIIQIGDPAARMAADHINKIFVRAQKKHLRYLSEIRSELEAAFHSLDVDEKIDALTRETLRHYSVVNAYLAR